MDDVLKFRTFVTPKLIQLIFFLGVIACVLAGFASMAQGGVFGGLLLLLIGLLVVRIYCELTIIIFSIHDRLKGIEDKAGEV